MLSDVCIGTYGKSLDIGHHGDSMESIGDLTVNWDDMVIYPVDSSGNLSHSEVKHEPYLYLVYLLKVMIFNSYVSSPKGNQCHPPKTNSLNYKMEMGMPKFGWDTCPHVPGN